MDDRQKMINELNFQLHSKEVVEHHDPIQLSVTAANKILKLLKEREHTKPYRPEELWLCKECDQTIGWDDILGIEDTLYNYCPNCGRIVDWDEFPWLKEGKS